MSAAPCPLRVTAVAILSAANEISNAIAKANGQIPTKLHLDAIGACQPDCPFQTARGCSIPLIAETMQSLQLHSVPVELTNTRFQ